jgi:lipopolysaccharide biosynthesis protein
MQEGASIFLGSTPEKYKEWLSHAINDTISRFAGEERIVFVNAWNEWAEGNHLEPDQRFGHGYLEATGRALAECQLAIDSRQPGASDEVRIGQLMSQLVNHNEHLSKWERQLAQRKQRIEELLSKREKRLARRDQQIEELLNSTSWRATVPLRWVKYKLREIKKLFAR